MSHELSWFTDKRVLRLNMHNGLSLDELMSINKSVLEILEKSENNLTLFIDASTLTAGYSTVDYLRDTQEYRDHRKLDTIVILANNRLIRLITLLAFSLSRAPFVQFDSVEKVQNYLALHGVQNEKRAN